MKPEAGQWWVMDDDPSEIVFVVGFTPEMECVIKWGDGDLSVDEMTDFHHEPRCTGWDWVVPEPQPAEDPDEWVIQDRVPVRPGIDRITWHSSSAVDSIPPHPRGDSQGKRHGDVHSSNKLCTLRVWCRRRDLPKVEQCAACDAPAEEGTAGCKDCNEYATAICSPEPEQWPKYYRPLHECRTADGKPVAFFKMRGVDDGETFHTDGTSFRWSEWVSGLAPIEITEAEAMALLKKPKQCAVGCHGPRCHNPALPGKDHCGECADEEPQPQKTRVRLFASFGALHMRMPGEITEGIGKEIHHDSEGFYVENRP